VHSALGEPTCYHPQLTQEDFPQEELITYPQYRKEPGDDIDIPKID
jgi:hypothetical protein